MDIAKRVEYPNSFSIISRGPIIHMFQFMDLLTIKIFGITCKKFKRYVKEYMSRCSHETWFVQKHDKLLTLSLERLRFMNSQVKQLRKKLALVGEFNGQRPDALMCNKTPQSEYSFSWQPIGPNFLPPNKCMCK